MDELIGIIEELKNSKIRETVDSRMKEFEELGKKGSEDIFRELCFCLLTANFSASGGIKIQNEIGEGFLVLPESELARKLSELGHSISKRKSKIYF